MVAVPVDARRRDQAAEGGEELQRGKGQDAPTVRQWAGGEVEDAPDGALLARTAAAISCYRLRIGRGGLLQAHALQGKRRPGAA